MIFTVFEGHAPCACTAMGTAAKTALKIATRSARFISNLRR
jgi:hypothetical protein